jgi:hypothetical protein
MGTLGILGSKFLKILKLMGTLVGVDWGWSGWGWKVVGAHLIRCWEGGLSTFTFLPCSEAQFAEHLVAGKYSGFGT